MLIHSMFDVINCHVYITNVSVFADNYVEY